ncbi:MAG: hypothetical protein WCV86_03385 [Patescibacteria group bacterium]|jgi:photosystem II stability/assembly factor-like uncharacterized protein
MRRKTLLLVAFFSALLFTGAACGFIADTPPDGGIFASTDRGETFKQRNFVAQQGEDVVTLNFTNIFDIVFHPVDPDIIYAPSLGAGIYKTLDGGKQWTKTGLARGSYGRLIIDRVTPSTLYATNNRSILKSVDAGENWSEVYIETRSDQSITDLALDPQTPGRVIATTSTGGVLVSSDFAGTWDVQQWISRGIAKIFYHPTNSDTFYLLTTDHHLLRTRDGGERFADLNENWEEIVQGRVKLYDLVFRESAPDLLYLATSYGILKSIDSGDSWVLQNTLVKSKTVAIKHIGLHPSDPLTMYFVAGRTLHRSFDGGEEWAVRSIPTSREITSFRLHPSDPNSLFFGTQLIKK